MRWKKILVIFGVIIVGLAAASLIILFSYDYNKFKPYIAQAAKEATGRELKLAGDLKFRLGFTPALVIENISFQNAPWGSRPEMARVKRLDLEVALLPLLSRNIQINRFRLIEPDILLEINKDGVSNLSFATTKEAKRTETKDKKKDEKVALSAFLVRELLIEKGQLAYRDSRSLKTYALTLDRLSLSMEANKPLQMKGNGTYNRVAFEFAAQAGSLEALTGQQKEWPLSLKAEAAEASLSLEGTVRDLLGGRGFQFNLAIKSKDPAMLSPLVGTPIPIRGPLEISARVTDPAPRVYKVANLKMVLDKSDLEGDAEINLTGARPRLKGNISSRLLDLKSLASSEPKAEVRQPKEAKPSAKAARIFPDDPLPVEFLRALDAEMKLSAQKILLPHLVLEKLQVDVFLKDGALALKPLRALIGGGSLDGSVNLRAEGKEVSLDSAVKIDRFDAGLLLKEFAVTNLFEGKMDTVLDFRGKGDSIAALMGGLSGKTQAVMSRGRIDRRYVDLLGEGISGNLLRLMNPLMLQTSNVELNCFLAFFEIRSGLAKSTALALDTSYLTVLGEGTVNLKTEELDFSFNPAPKATLRTKGGTALALDDLFKSLRLTGTLAHPTLGIGSGVTSLAIGKIIGGGLAGLTGSISGAGEKEEQDFCPAAIEKAKRGGKETPPKKESGAPEKRTPQKKSPADQAEDAFRKIFGR